MAELPPSEVKGAWFVAARDYALEVHGPDVLEQLIAQSPAKYRDIYAAPIASAWYPEDALQEALSMIHEIVAQESDFLFEQIIEGCTVQGVHRLFQMVMRLSSPGFVLRLVPTMWRQIRRGAGQVDVTQYDGFTELRYSEFPWFHDRLYRLLTTGSLRALVKLCTREGVRIDVLEHARDSLALRINYRASEQPLPGRRHASTRPVPASELQRFERAPAIHSEISELSGIVRKDEAFGTSSRPPLHKIAEAKARARRIKRGA
jgi:hypothetical protein